MVLVVSGVVAVVAVRGGRSRHVTGSGQLVTAGLSLDVQGEPTGTTTTATPETTATTRAVATSSVPVATRPPTTTGSATAPTTAPTPAATAPTSGAPGTPPTPYAVDPLTGNPAITQPYAPGAWRVTVNGITIDGRIEPAAPKLGDTVRFSFSAGGEGDFCCDLSLYMGGDSEPLYRSPPVPGPCPLPHSAAGEASYVVTGRGPVGFHINANGATNLCTAPPRLVSGNLFAGFVVEPW